MEISVIFWTISLIKTIVRYKQTYESRPVGLCALLVRFWPEKNTKPKKTNIPIILHTNLSMRTKEEKKRKSADLAAGQIFGRLKV